MSNSRSYVLAAGGTGGHMVPAAALGAGRQKKSDPVDHGVGVRLHTHVGARIAAGEPIVTVYGRTEQATFDAARKVEDATIIVPAAQATVARERSVIIERRG